MIPNYLQNVLSKFQDLEETPDGWLCPCPCPGHGDDGTDSTPSLRITVGLGGRVLVVCRVGCPLNAILTSVGLTPPQLFCPPGEVPAEQLSHEYQGQGSDDRLDLRHRVYSDLLAELTLDPDHEDNLRARGLTPEVIEQNRYKTARAAQKGTLAHKLFQKYGEDLYQVPGFVVGDYGPTIHGDFSGLLIPVRDLYSRVIALKMRRNREPKYIYLSGGKNGGSPGNPVHISFTDITSGEFSLRITEGELKADVCNTLTDVPTIGIPGVNNWWRCLPVVADLSPKRVLVAFDWPDVVSKRGVCHQLYELLAALRQRGYECGVETWDQEVKGIDDLLAANVRPAEVWGDEALNLVRSALDTSHSAGVKKTDDPLEKQWEPCPFPVEVFPHDVINFIDRVSNALPCPPDFLGVGCLVIAGAMLGSVRRIQVKEGWEEQPNMYAVIVAPPGQLKSPALRRAGEPIKELQKVINRKYHEDLTKYNEDKTIYKAKFAAYEFNLKNYYKNNFHGENEPQPPADRPVPPTLEHVYADDFTVESLGEMLKTSPRGVAIVKDELTAWIRMFNQYKGGKGTDRQFFLSGWSGEEIKITRKGSMAAVHLVEEPFIAVLGSIQPDMLHELEDQRGREDGFVHRILFSIPDVEPVPPLTEDIISYETRQLWCALANRLRQQDFDTELIPREDGTTMSVKKKKVLTLTPEAHTAFWDWHERHRAEAKTRGFPRNLQGPWSKYKAYMARFCLVIHLLRYVSGETTEENFIELEDVNRAEKLVDYFKCHVRGVFLKFSYDENEKKLEDFLEWLTHEKNGYVETREIHRTGRFGKTSTAVKKFLEYVIDRGFGKFDTDNSCSKRGRQVFTLNKPEED